MNLNIKNTPKRLKKKEAILESAVKIFALHGYNSTRLEQITHDLQLTDKSIYYYFSSKGDLFIEVILLIQQQLNQLIKKIEDTGFNHHDKIKNYTHQAMSIEGLTLLMYFPRSLSEFAKYEDIKSNEAKHFKVWANWLKKGQLEGSVIQGDANEQRNFLFGSLFYLHRIHSIQDNESYSKIQPFIDTMIDRMFSTNYNIKL